MPKIELNTSLGTMDTTNDNIVIQSCLEDIKGGKSLDATGWPHMVIPGGHPIIKDDDGEYKPLALNEAGDAIDATKAAKTIGILKFSVLAAKPFAAIMVRGTVNEAAAVFAIPAGAKTPLGLIRFMSE